MNKTRNKLMDYRSRMSKIHIYQSQVEKNIAFYFIGLKKKRPLI
jgi:hypothetical protein